MMELAKRLIFQDEQLCEERRKHLGRQYFILKKFS